MLFSLHFDINLLCLAAAVLMSLSSRQSYDVRVCVGIFYRLYMLTCVRVTYHKYIYTILHCVS